MNDLDPGELATTIVHQSHVIRRLELALTGQADHIVALEAQLLTVRQQSSSPDLRDPAGHHLTSVNVPSASTSPDSM